MRLGGCVPLSHAAPCLWPQAPIPGAVPQITVVYIDCVNASALEPGVAAAALTEYLARARPLLAAAGGFEVTHRGFAVVALFPSVRDALLCCLRFRVALLPPPWPAGVPEAAETCRVVLGDTREVMTVPSRLQVPS